MLVTILVGGLVEPNLFWELALWRFTFWDAARPLWRRLQILWSRSAICVLCRHQHPTSLKGPRFPSPSGYPSPVSWPKLRNVNAISFNECVDYWKLKCHPLHPSAGFDILVIPSCGPCFLDISKHKCNSNSFFSVCCIVEQQPVQSCHRLVATPSTSTRRQWFFDWKQGLNWIQCPGLFH